MVLIACLENFRLVVGITLPYTVTGDSNYDLRIC